MCAVGGMGISVMRALSTEAERWETAATLTLVVPSALKSLVALAQLAPLLVSPPAQPPAVLRLLLPRPAPSLLADSLCETGLFTLLLLLVVLM